MEGSIFWYKQGRKWAVRMQYEYAVLQYMFMTMLNHNFE